VLTPRVLLDVWSKLDMTNDLQTSTTVDPKRTDEFVRLWSGSARQVYAYIYSMLPHQSDADDVLQEVGATLWQKFSEYEQGTSFTAWARRTAYYKVLHHYQQRDKTPRPLDIEFLNVIDDLSTRYAAALEAQHQALADCYQLLRSKDQELIKLRYAQGATTKSVAKNQGRTVASVYKALSRVHSALMECIDRRVAREGQA